MVESKEFLRLANLHSYDIGDEYPKEHLESIIRLASGICNTPVSLVDIIDEFNQRTIATHGDWNEQVIPREKSICDKVVVNEEMLILNNIEDSEEISSRLSKEDRQKIKFYAGAPLKSPEGYTIGALCVIDSKPRKLSEFQKESLKTLANEIIARLLLHKQARVLNKKNNILKKYSFFLKNSADLLCIIDSETKTILDINDDCYSELGYSREELIQQSFLTIIESENGLEKTISSWFKKNTDNKSRLSLPVQLKNKQGAEKWYRCNFTTEGNHWYLTARNISAQKKAEDRVKTLQSRFEKLVYATTDLIYQLEWKDSKLSWYGDLTGILGYPETDKNVDFDWWMQKVHPEDAKELFSEINAIAASDAHKWSKTYRLRSADGSYKYMLNNSHIDRNKKGEPTVILGALSDITKLRKAELRQKRLLSKLQHANHLAKLGSLELDLIKGTVSFDDEITHALGLNSRPDTLTVLLDSMDQNTRDIFRSFIKDITEGHGAIEKEHKVKTANSTAKYLLHRGEQIQENGIPAKILITTQDITDQKLKELRISESLKEKEVLLSEIHHRVKNNLAIVSCLLEMNLFQIEDRNSINLIQDSQLRIQSMAMIHEKLYQSGSFTHVLFKEYIHDLIESIRKTMSSPECKLEIKTNIDDVRLNLNYAIPCGLILNELITNSWKHAFPNKKSGVITISFFGDNNQIHLAVTDNGIGLPDDYDFDSTQSMGITLIKILSDQIDGKLSIGSSKDGFSCNLTFLTTENRKGSSSSFV